MPSVFLIRRCQPSLQKAQARLASTANWKLCGSGDMVRDAPEALQAVHADFIACDLRLYDGHASRLGYAMREWPRRPQLLLLSPTADDLQLFDALLAGGHSYCVDDGSGQGLIAGLQHLAEGRARMSPLLARQTLETFGLARSSLLASTNPAAAHDTALVAIAQMQRADQHLLSLLSQGLLAIEIAQRWQLAQAEVERRLAGIYVKLHALGQPVRRPQPAAPWPDDQALGGAVSTKLGRAANFS